MIQCLTLVKITVLRLGANLVKDFFEKIYFPPMRALEFVTSHVTFKLCYDKLTENHPSLAELVSSFSKQL